MQTKGIARYRYTGKDRKALQALLRDHGFYSTEGRLEMLSLLKKAHRPVSVPGIVAQLTERLDQVNVYRALEALTKKEILTRSDVRHGGAHYEFAEGHHHHLVCNECGKTEDVQLCADTALEARALQHSDSFALIQTHALEFFGTCRVCARLPGLLLLVALFVR